MIGTIATQGSYGVPWSEQTEKLFEHDLTADFDWDRSHIDAIIIADSINTVNNKRLITLQLTIPRIILSEFNTHRCLTADTILEFDAPATLQGNRRRKGITRTTKYTIGEFYDRWMNGAAAGKIGSVDHYNTDKLDLDTQYTVGELSKLTGICVSSIRQACRKDEMAHKEFYNPNCGHHSFLIKGKDFVAWREYKENKTRRFPIRHRLKEMNLRCYNPQTQQVETTHVTNIWCTGEKETLVLTTKTGNKIQGSYDHLILTNHGWKELQDVVIGRDKVYELIDCITDDDRSQYARIVDNKHVSQWIRENKSAVYDRQHGRCNYCGKELPDVWDMHHLKPVRTNPDLAFDVNNVVGLCPQCHKQVHREMEKMPRDSKRVLQCVEVDIVSVVKGGKRVLYDIEVDADHHTFLANRIVVHNCLSRNTSSSRAIPAKKVRANIVNNMFYPVYWGINKSGMSADEQLTGWKKTAARSLWRTAGLFAVGIHKTMESIGIHKQTCNRILEPWTHVYTVVTSSEWENFLRLRYNKNAQPEMICLAKAIHDAIKFSVPRVLTPEDVHLPYITEQEAETRSIIECIKTSVARCCRVSYKSNETGKLSDFDKDVALFERLYKDHHMSPFEHVGFVPNQGRLSKETHIDLQRNFRGWYQFRAFVDPADNLKYLNKFYSINLDV